MFDFIKELDNNPLYLKEKIIQKRGRGKRRFSIPESTGYLAILLMPLFFLMAFNKWNYTILNDGVKITFGITCYLQILYFCYRALSASFYLIVKEKEQRTFLSIITTPITPEEILKGKFLSAFCPVAKELTLLFPLFLLLGILAKLSILKLLGVYFLSMGYIIFIITGGLWASTIARNSQVAHSWTGGIIGFMPLGTYVFAMLMNVFVRIFTDSCGLIEKATFFPLALNPFSHLSVLLYLDSYRHNNFMNEDFYIFFFCIVFTGLTYCLTGSFFWNNTLKRLRYIP